MGLAINIIGAPPESKTIHGPNCPELTIVRAAVLTQLRRGRLFRQASYRILAKPAVLSRFFGSGRRTIYLKYRRSRPKGRTFELAHTFLWKILYSINPKTLENGRRVPISIGKEPVFGRKRGAISPKSIRDSMNGSFRTGIIMAYGVSGWHWVIPAVSDGTACPLRFLESLGGDFGCEL